MEVLVRLEVAARARRRPTVDVALSVEPTHTVAEVVAAIADHLGDGPRSVRLVRRNTDDVLDPAAEMSSIGLLSGETLTLVGDGEPAHHRPVTATGPAIVVASGPDVGRRAVVTAAGLTVGRDRSCGLTVSDPNTARMHLDVTAGGGERDTADPEPPEPRLRVGPSPEAERPVSINGTPIDRPVNVADDHVIRIGATTLTVDRADSEPRAVSQAPADRARRDPGESSVEADDGEPQLGQIPFHRTPYYPSPVEERVFDALGEIPERGEPPMFAYLAALAPIALGVTLAAIYSPRMLVFAVFSPVIAVATYVEARRRNRSRYGRGEKRYRRKLAERRVDLRTALAGERRRRFEAAPDVATLAARARDRAPELWIRDRPAPDFLLLRVGLGSVPAAVTVKPETRGDEALRDELERELDSLATLDDVPQTIDVAGEHVVGLVGSDADTTQLAASLVVQAACLHSPEDLVVVGAAHPDRAMTSWMKWLPHARSASSPLALDHLARTTEEANRLLRELLAVAEQRAGERDRTIDRRWPRLLAVIDRRLEPEPAVVSRLLDLCPTTGISVLWLTAGPDRVPRQARSVVTCAPLLGAGPSTIASTDPTIGDRRVEIDRVPVARADAVARCLAPIRDASSATGSTALPRTVTLHQALGTDIVDRDWVIGRWSEPRGHSLPTPIGLAVGGPLVLDLVAQGPHGLIGGTSGSGKSELLMSIVAGLAAVNPPTALNLLFVDYKGGASSDLFTGLPHTVGYVTNLDAHLARRALISLRAELNRRMDLLQGRAKDLAEMVERHPGEAPPSLVIVVDEFATLVKEVPDFIAGIVDIAQRGRSLGIHLLLATQRPSGSINENILANTNLRISLRVLDGAESSSVIGTTDAATIPTPLRGRAFARIGPGELVAFQSAWSGAPLLAAAGPPPVAVAPFTSADPRRAIARPATSGSQVAGTDDSRTHLGGTQIGINETATTQIDGLLAAIDGAANQLGLGPGRSPWLEELPTELPLAAVRPATAGGHTGGWSVALGLVDDPERQAQYAARVDFEAGGGLAIFGTGGSGKTTALRTLAVSAALDDAEARAAAAGRSCPLTIVGLDYASRELAAVAALPQCAMIATGDDTESSTRLIAVLDELLQRRRAALAAAARHGSDPPTFGRVLLLIDDYGNLAQSFEGAGAPAALYGWLETLNRVIVDGRQVGVHTALTASRRSVVKAGVLSAISNRIVLRQSDPGGYAELGLSSGSLADLDLDPGRGFLHSGHTMQVAEVSAAPATAGSAEAVRAVAARIDTPVEPELVTAPLPAELPLLTPSRRPLEVPIGIGDLSTEPVNLDLTVNDLTIVGDPRSGRSTALMTIGHQLTVTGREVWAVGPGGSPLAGLESLARAGFGRADAVAPVIEEVVELGDGAAPDEAPILLIDDADLLQDPSLEPPMAKLCSVGVRWVAAAVGLRGYSTNQLLQEMKKARSVLYLQPPGPREVQEVTGCLPQIRPGLPMPPGRGVLVVNRYPTVVQLSRP